MVDHSATIEAEMLTEAPYNAADPKMVNEARKRAARAKKEELDFTAAIMSSPQGRRWMFDMLNTCKTFANPVVSGDPYYTYHNIGEQNIGKKLLQDINDSAPAEYVLMMKEAKENKKR